MNLERERERERERETLRGWRPALRSRAWRSRTSSPSLLLLLLSTVADHEEEEDSRIGWELSPLLPLLLLLLLSDSFFSTTNSIFNFFFSKALVFSLSLSLSLSTQTETKKETSEKTKKRCTLQPFVFFFFWVGRMRFSYILLAYRDGSFRPDPVPIIEWAKVSLQIKYV